MPFAFPGQVMPDHIGRKRRRLEASHGYAPYTGGGGLPARFASASGWWDAANLGDGAVPVWTSRSDTGSEFLQPTAANQPTRSAAVVSFEGSAAANPDRMSRARSPAKKVSQVSVPQGQNGPAGSFTCTGLSKNSAGVKAVGNHGLPTESSSGFQPAIEFVNEDGSRPAPERVDLVGLYGSGNVGSCQGVSWGATNDEIWWADVLNSKIRLVRRVGNIWTAVTASDIALTYVPTGVAYSARRNAVFILPETAGGVIEIRSCVDGSLIDSRNNFGAPGQDQICLDERVSGREVLFITAGVNGTNGTVYAYWWQKSYTLGSAELPGSTSIEGVQVDFVSDQKWRLTITNDGLFHQPSGGDGVNAFITYEISPLYGTVMDLFYVGSMPTASAGTKVLLEFQFQPGDGNGPSIALQVPSLTALRLAANTAATGTGELVVADATGLASLTAKTVVVARIDTASDQIVIMTNGVTRITQGAAALADLLSVGGQLRLNHSASAGREPNTATSAIGFCVGGFSDGLGDLSAYLTERYAA